MSSSKAFNSDVDLEKEEEILHISKEEYQSAASVGTLTDVCIRTDTMSSIDPSIINSSQDVNMIAVTNIDDPNDIPALQQ